MTQHITAGRHETLTIREDLAGGGSRLIGHLLVSKSVKISFTPAADLAGKLQLKSIRVQKPIDPTGKADVE